MIRKLTVEDRKLYVEMAHEFYHSDAVLHPVPDAFFERTADEALQSGQYAEIFVFEYEDRPWPGIWSDRKVLFSGSRRRCMVDRGGIYQRGVPLQRAWEGVLPVSGGIYAA